MNRGRVGSKGDGMDLKGHRTEMMDRNSARHALLAPSHLSNSPFPISLLSSLL